jgi:type IV secretory pathway ATPase VirB11/archaellum biosynthesis ATPase
MAGQRTLCLQPRIGSSAMDLREYEQTKFQLAELLRSSGASSSELPRQVQDQVRELFGRLAEDRFNLVVVGRFSRGKTSLMNAVLGTDCLPTGIRPLTSVITPSHTVARKAPPSTLRGT